MVNENECSSNLVLSVISPISCGETLVDVLVSRLTEVLGALRESYEIILVEDGSHDGSWSKIASRAAGDTRIKGIKFARNFGQHSAITAGLACARGDYVVVIDCDLQDDPKYIGVLLTEGRKGFDIVFTRRAKRAHSLFRNLAALLFNRIFNWLSENDKIISRNDVGAFSLLSRKAVESFKLVRDYHRHYLLILRWIGLRSCFVEVEHCERLSGRSSYSFAKLFRHAVDGITSQSTRLLYLVVVIGLIFCLLALAGAFMLVVLYWIHGFKAGWTSLAVLMLLSTGTILLALGIIGVYIGKIFEQVKQRPLYIIESTINVSPDVLKHGVGS